MSQYIRGLVKSQSVLVNYNSFLGFSRVGNSPFNLLSTIDSMVYCQSSLVSRHHAPKTKMQNS